MSAEPLPPPLPNDPLSGGEWQAVLERHARWVQNAHQDGECADLIGTDLRGRPIPPGVNLSGAFLWSANLSGVNLVRADLSGAKLGGANLSRAKLRYAKLARVELQDANLSEADLGRADLTGAHLEDANLSGADLDGADLSGARLMSADLTGAALRHANLSDADLRGAHGLRLDQTFIRNCRFTPVGNRFWAVACNHLFARVRRTALRFPRRDNDPWSVLRQMYAGPRVVVLLLGLLAFAAPYVGRVAMYGLLSRAEAAFQKQTEVGAPWEDFAEWPSNYRAYFQRRSVLALLLKWDQGAGHTALALVLVAYNIGVYRLISRVGPLRDEEERSGFAPAWAYYRGLIWVHRAVCLLFYVSLASFCWNLYVTLATPIWVPAPRPG
jgi:uncharacterized protein YjbI with pentapeptide repeats